MIYEISYPNMIDEVNNFLFAIDIFINPCYKNDIFNIERNY